MKNKAKPVLLAALLCIGLAVPAQANDRHCREFSKDIRIDGQWQPAYGTACLQADGSWEILDTTAPSRPTFQRYASTSPTVIYHEPRPQVVIERPQRQIIIDPFASFYQPDRYRYYQTKRVFREHHGPHWRQHWKHHKKHYKRGHRKEHPHHW